MHSVLETFSHNAKDSSFVAVNCSSCTKLDYCCYNKFISSIFDWPQFFEGKMLFIFILVLVWIFSNMYQYLVNKWQGNPSNLILHLMQGCYGIIIWPFCICMTLSIARYIWFLAWSLPLQDMFCYGHPEYDVTVICSSDAKMMIASFD